MCVAGLIRLPRRVGDKRLKEGLKEREGIVSGLGICWWNGWWGSGSRRTCKKCHSLLMLLQGTHALKGIA